MTPKYTKVLQYDVTVTCESPLHTGSSDRREILRDSLGNPFLQGTSLCGALRAWRNDDVLFGVQDRPGELILSDLIFEDVPTVVRPRVRIDRKTGSASDGGKFDTEGLAIGTRGRFSMVWRGECPLEQMRQKLEDYLSALNGGLISLGGQKTNGFGRVSLQASVTEFDLLDRVQLNRWLNGTGSASRVVLKPVQDERILFRVQGITPGLLVKAADGKGSGRESIQSVPYQENDTYLIPGSSIKGVIRTQMERIADAMHRPELVPQLLGFAESDHSAAGKLIFGDGHFAGNPVEVRQARIRIDRFTGSVIQGGGPFKQINLSGKLEWEIRIPRRETAGCALLLFALRDLGLGIYALGSGSSIGKGRFDRLEVHADSLTLTVQNGNAILDDPDGLGAQWLAELGGNQE